MRIRVPRCVHGSFGSFALNRAPFHGDDVLLSVRQVIVKRQGHSDITLDLLARTAGFTVGSGGQRWGAGRLGKDIGDNVSVLFAATQIDGVIFMLDVRHDFTV